MRKYFFLEEPVAKGRPRLTTVGGHARAFTPDKTRNFESTLRSLAQVQNTQNNWEPFKNVALKIIVKFFLHKPKSAKKRNYPIVKPDLDNFLKCLDAFNEIIWIDDSLICDIHATKEYSTHDGFIVLEVEQIENEQR